MKILLSAYSCRPNMGSELGVGWRWAIELAELGNDVFVLTRTVYKDVIEQALKQFPRLNLTFIYYDPPRWAGWWHKRGSSTIYFHYYLWQVLAFGFIRKKFSLYYFDLVHHITLGGFRQPSLLHFLPVPFVFGPVGGGEAAPAELRKKYPKSGKRTDLVRDIVNWLAGFDPFLRALYIRSNLILCKTEDTRNIIPQKYRHKAIVKREIGIELSEDTAGVIDSAHNTMNDGAPLRLLYVGRLLYWKGLHLGLEAFTEFLRDNPDTELTIIGAGPDEEWLRSQAAELGIEANTHWLGKIDHVELLKKYRDFDVFLFPSLHDSSGNVVLEAMSAGLPVVCLDLGGPPTMVDDSCGSVVPARHTSHDDVVSGLIRALTRFANDRDYLASCSKGAIAKVRSMTWRNTVIDTYNTIEKMLEEQAGGKC